MSSILPPGRFPPQVGVERYHVKGSNISGAVLLLQPSIKTIPLPPLFCT